MYLFDLFRSFLPLHNPIGFGASDFIELAFAGLLVLLVLARARIEPLARKLAQKTGWCMLFLAGLTIALRLALLPAHPVPTPQGADDFSYLLLSDTLAHFRLANPPHPLHQFFETNFVLQEPAYSSIYPIGPALALALGQVVFRLPWAGVVLAVAAFCALCYWMLRGWTTPGWALLGGLLAVCEFGPLSYWMNCYWGGAVSAAAGCLVFGALPRLRERGRIRDAILLGVGIGAQMLSRPYESLILDVAVVLFFLPALPKFAKRAPVVVLAVGLAVLPAIALLAFHNRAVTGSWTTLPYMLSRYQYGVPTTFTFQPNPVPHAHLTADQQLYYEGQSAVHDAAPGFFGRLASRLPFARFFLLPPLFLALPFFLLLVREFRFAWVALTLLLFVVGCNFYPYFFPHYVAAAACLVLLAAVAGLERLGRFNGLAARWIIILCGAHFLFWYGLHALGDERILSAMSQYGARDVIAHGDPEHRVAIDTQLAQAPGKQLVFVRYWAGHGYHEWMHNAADVDSARVVMALDLGPDENAALERYYPGRAVWLLEPDALPPRLTPYHVRMETAPAPTPAPVSKVPNNGMVLEQVR
jgi:hypothetical protein